MKKKKKEKKQEKKQEINLEQALDSVANTVFANMKLYVDKKLAELEPFFETLEDTKVNMATLSSLLHAKELFTKEEFSSCFTDIQDSFGIVLPDGTIKGQVERTDYNFA